MLEFAKKIISIEAETLSQTANALDEEFIHSIDHLAQIDGRIIVTGLGKSALVGRKISATLNSTGTPSYFLHSADALHGDLGMITNDDAVIVISKSGEGEELRSLLPHIKKKGVFILGIVAQPSSYLATIADRNILTPIEKEADPNNLAPSASSTAQMAVGDAIALCLQQLKNFQPSDFAELHPAGSLGRQLLLEVGDVMQTQPQQDPVSMDTSLKEVIVEITRNRMGACIVADQQGQIIGIITDGDLRRMLQQEKEPLDLVARDVMTPNPVGISTNTLAKEALYEMNKRKITQLLVFDHDRQFKGLVHIHDLISLGLQ